MAGRLSSKGRWFAIALRKVKWLMFSNFDIEMIFKK
jgi:hypothetical protein